MDRQLASVRNVLDLRLTEKSPAESLHIAQALDEVTSKLKQEEIGEVCCPLPLPLQDLCLLVIVSDLNTHQVDLLASLPRWFRQCLLYVLPALDLGRLEHTAIAAGLDVEPIWNCKWKETALDPVFPRQTLSGNPWRSIYTVHNTLQAPLSRSSGSGNSFAFQLNVSKTDKKLPGLMEEVNVALKNVKQRPEGKASLLTIASDILTKYPDIDINEMIQKLISVRGDLVFSSLQASAIHEPCQTSQCGQRVWKKQATALAVNVKSLEDYSIHPPRHQRTSFWSRNLRGPCASTKMVDNTYLTPHRLLPILYRYNPLELLSLLATDCGLQPSTAYLHIDSICKMLLSELCSERLALDCNCSHASDSYTSVLNHFLEKVIVLGLCCDSYSHISIVVGFIDGVATNREKCQLKHLICAMPNLYLDALNSLSAVFSLPSFCQLTLEVNELNPMMLCKLLQEFMTTPCSHTQKLMIRTRKELLSSLPKSLKENQVATMKGNTRAPLPFGSAQHKELQLSSQKEYTLILQIILQLPSIRLKEIVLDNLDDYPDYLHLCAIHPDLHTTKLTIDLSRIQLGCFSTSRQSDLITLFQMTSLQEIYIYGNWGTDEHVKLGLVNGLRSRNRSFPLTQLALMLEINNSYKMSDLQTLCDAIFSLPQLENFELVLGEEFGKMFRQPSYEQLLHRSWCCRASNVQLKSICVSGYISKSKYLSLVAKEYSNSTQLRDVRTLRRIPRPFMKTYGSDYNVDYDDEYDDDEYDDDEYYDDGVYSV